jgi:TetR/AcrR family transcriptional repressor of nem operon
MTRKPIDKRASLVNVAKSLIYKQGFNITTLADIANEADVPLGNVYYYFKAKKDIGMAVLNSIAFEQKIFLENLNKEPSSKIRLHYFLGTPRGVVATKGESPCGEAEPDALRIEL